MRGLGAEFENLGLPWLGVVHRPDPHSDQRNYHIHLIYHDRTAFETLDGKLRFMRRKCPACRGRDFIPSLRERYCELVNDEFERAGLARRWDPRRYELMGIAKEPGERLGTKAAALERKGIATGAGTRNAGREFGYRLRQLQHTLAVMTDEARVQVLETVHALAAARRHRAGPELTEVAIVLSQGSQGAQDYAAARAIQAAALVE